MSIYSPADFEKIASALRKPAEAILAHANQLEEAAFWYLKFESNPLNGKPSALRAEAKTIEKAARKLLKTLAVDDPAQAPDGPAPRILELLMRAQNAQESAIVDATDRIGRLADVCSGIAVAREIASFAEKASRGIQELADAIGLTGHKGDQALEIWLGSMMSLDTRIIGSPPKMNVGASGRLDEGKAGGVFLDFLLAAGAPLGITRSKEALRSKARAVLEHSSPKK